MEILIIALLAILTLVVLSRFVGRGQEKALKQYDVLEKRFRLERKVFRSRWGKGIGERYTLIGEYRGYPLSIYFHFRREQNGERHNWTSLVFEALFAEDVSLDVEFPGSQAAARFPERESPNRLDVGEGVTVATNQPDTSAALLTEGLRKRLASFAGLPTCGVVRLDKGFLEYRETGMMVSDEMRVRFQEAIMLLGDLADAVSIFVVQRRRGKED